MTAMPTSNDADTRSVTIRVSPAPANAPPVIVRLPHCFRGDRPGRIVEVVTYQRRLDGRASRWRTIRLRETDPLGKCMH